MMARIAAFHLGLDRGVAAAPEAGKIARHLHRSLSRGQQRDDERDPSSRNGGMAVEPEQLLDADCDLRPFFGFIIDRDGCARGRREMGRRLGVEPAIRFSLRGACAMWLLQSRFTLNRALL